MEWNAAPLVQATDAAGEGTREITYSLAVNITNRLVYLAPSTVVVHPLVGPIV